MVEKNTPALEFWQRLNRNRLSTVGLLMLGLIFVLCLITPWLPLPDPDATDLANRLKRDNGEPLEFKDNSLSILTSSVIKYNEIDRVYIEKSIQKAEENLSKAEINDQQKFLISQKINTLRSIKVN